jgi:hypothetical protein
VTPSPAGDGWAEAVLALAERRRRAAAPVKGG